MTDRDGTAGFYAAEATHYDRSRWSTRGGAATHADQRRLFQAMTSSWEPGCALEVGCGTGRFTAALVDRARVVMIADASREMLRIARTVRRADDVPVLATAASATDLPYASGTFDHVVCLNVLNHVEAVDRALVELADVLRPGGELLVNFANRHSVYWPVAAYVTRRHRAIGRDVYSRWDRRDHFLSLVDQAGLEVVEERGHVHAPQAISRWLPALAVRAVNRVVANQPWAGAGSYVFLRCRRRSSIDNEAPRPDRHSNR